MANHDNYFKTDKSDINPPDSKKRKTWESDKESLQNMEAEAIEESLPLTELHEFAETGTVSGNGQEENPVEKVLDDGVSLEVSPTLQHDGDKEVRRPVEEAGVEAAPNRHYGHPLRRAAIAARSLIRLELMRDGTDDSSSDSTFHSSDMSDSETSEEEGSSDADDESELCNHET